MSWSREKRRRLGRLLVPLPVLGALAYLGFHFLEGERGLKAWWGLSHKLDLVRAEYESLRTERERLEARVAMMREATLDRDLLEERVRRMLNLVHPGEVVILFDKPLLPDQKTADSGKTE
jgi:cell division protein FtsB